MNIYSTSSHTHKKDGCMYYIPYISFWMISIYSVFQWNGDMIRLFFPYIFKFSCTSYLIKRMYFNEHATINEWLIYCRSRMVRGLSGARGCSYDIRTFRCIQWLAGPPAWTGRGHQSFPQSDLWNNTIKKLF